MNSYILADLKAESLSKDSLSATTLALSSADRLYIHATLMLATSLKCSISFFVFKSINLKDIIVTVTDIMGFWGFGVLGFWGNLEKLGKS